jgi:muramoyltetrapeptide carboxypeptidase
MTYLLPPFLKPGDTIGLVAPARSVAPEEMTPFKQWAQTKGYKVAEAPSLYAIHHQWAGTDPQRLSQLLWAYETKEIKALWCARGGYGVTRWIAELPDQLLLQHPKWLVGFSDCTLVLNKLYNAGIASVHGPMALQAAEKVPHLYFDQTLHLLEGIFNDCTVPAHPYQVRGEVVGYLAGGNLSLLAHSIGTALLPKAEHTILFLEDVDEYLYHIDRMLWQLRHAGYLQRLAGVVVGQLSDMKDHATPFGGDAYDVVNAHTRLLRCPVAFGMPAGHEAQHVPLPFGVRVKLQVEADGSRLQYLP